MRGIRWDRADQPDPDPVRRGLLVAALGALGGRWCLAREPQADAPDPEVSAVLARMDQAGLTVREESGRSSIGGRSHLVVGDAPEPFLRKALGLCEALAKDYLAHFPSRGFAVGPPKARLTVVVLSGPEAFAKYLGVEPGEDVGGQYDPATNRLVIFDNRAREGSNPLRARANTLTLMHEATHQLTFNTGLLDRDADVPLWLSEGLAMYAEVRSPDGRTRIGQPNRERLAVLREARAAGGWFRVADLVGNDAVLDDPRTEQLAYAQSWLLVYHLMQQGRSEQLREFLELIRPRRDAARRADDARRAFGEPDRLDEEIARTAAKLGARGH
jgi:hypothetical protein